MDSRTTKGWGFEAANGMLWPTCLETKEDAIEAIERETKEKWDVLERDWGIRMVEVVVQRPADVVKPRTAGYDLQI